MPFNAKLLRDSCRQATTTHNANIVDRDAKRNSKMKRLMGELQLYIMHTCMPTDEDMQKMASERKSGKQVFSMHLPINIRGTDDEGEFRQAKFPPELTHFSGYSVAEGLTDPRENGVPLISFFQGFQDDDHKHGNPDSLPGGKTIMYYLAEALLEKAGGDIEAALVPRTRFNGKECRRDLFFCWDAEGFDAWQAKEQGKKMAYAAKKDAERQHEAHVHEVEKKQVSAEDYFASRQVRSSAPSVLAVSVPAPNLEIAGFKMVSKKGRRNRD
jgi:hypothetical protein